ncbi:MAG: hypothetical protein NTV89_12865 [Proteobacteria bacterium]|nr:hypothetical protein [Pseudomonadota bacterium]
MKNNYHSLAYSKNMLQALDDMNTAVGNSIFNPAMAIIVTISVILAMGYFWYFPFYVSNSISYLSGKMQRLLEVAGITLDIQSDDETHIILQSINLLENKFSVKGKEKNPQ